MKKIVGIEVSRSTWTIAIGFGSIRLQNRPYSITIVI